MKTIKDIEAIIGWYATNYQGASITTLMDAKTKLVTLNYRLAEEVGESKKDSIISTMFRKCEFHNTKSRLIEDGFTLGKAESKSNVEIRDYMVREAETESLFSKYKLLLDHSVKVAEDLTQRISILKIEYSKQN